MLRHEAASTTTTDRHEYTFKQKALVFGASIGLAATAPFATVACSDAEPISPAATAAATGQTATETTAAPVTVQPPTSEQAPATSATSHGERGSHPELMPTNYDQFTEIILGLGYTPDKHNHDLEDGTWATFDNGDGKAWVFCGQDSNHIAILYHQAGDTGRWRFNGADFFPLRITYQAVVTETIKSKKFLL